MEEKIHRKPRILIVDDDATYRQLVTLQLTKAGYEVLLARDGQEAINWLRSEQRPDLILLDLLMPRLSGLDVMALLRTSTWKIPVILISGADWLIARQGTNEAQPDAFLLKPFSMQELLGKIESMIYFFPKTDLVD
ncbi:response regulator [Larkinella rosea]|uniref:Response regulator n=1 Tax=Larkinella rosea TaxID=2025312 RepID=A0A3P1C384_9BACT|nr:response regulator [Larkinella rosea]RRB07855.1 response regulator [Larkinella rosea]